MSGPPARDGAKAPVAEASMPTSAGNEAPQNEAKGGIGGLAGVFRGLTGSKQVKSSPVNPTTPSAAIVSALTASGEHSHANHTAPGPGPRLPQEQIKLLRQLKSAEVSERIFAAEGLQRAVTDHPYTPVLEIYEAARDLIRMQQPVELRRAGWPLLKACAGHRHGKDLERRDLFEILSRNVHPDDFRYQLTAVEVLANFGRDIRGFEYDVFPQLTAWLRERFDAVKVARRIAGQNHDKTKGKRPLTPEEDDFRRLFVFIEDMIKFNFKVASDMDVTYLLAELCNICNKTADVDDLRACIRVMNSVVTFGTIPGDKLKVCIDVLASILSAVPHLFDETWKALSDICKSHHGQSTVRICIEALKNYNVSLETKEMEHQIKLAKEAVRVVRGHLMILKQLLSPSRDKGYPQVAFNLLIEGLKNVENTTKEYVALDVLKLLNAMFDGPDGAISDIIEEEDWAELFEVATKCSDPAGKFLNPDSRSEAVRKEMADQLRQLIHRVEKLVSLRQSELLQREDCITFLTTVHHALPNSAVSLILDHFKACGSCAPSEPNWEANIMLVLDHYYHNRNLLTAIRIQALGVVTTLYWTVDGLPEDPDMAEPHFGNKLLDKILLHVEDETDVVVLQELVTFLVDVASTSETLTLVRILERLKRVLTGERAKGSTMLPLAPQTGQSTLTQGSSTSEMPYDNHGVQAGESLSNVVSRAIVRMFMRSMDTDAIKAQECFKMLVHVARTKDYESDARLTAMKLLFRLRADWNHHVYLTQTTDAEKLAASLYRTEDSLARKLAGEAAHPPRPSRADPTSLNRTSRGRSFTGQPGERGIPVRAVSGTSVASGGGSVRLPTQKALRLWSLPDPDALPAEPSDRASTGLLSTLEYEPKVTGKVDEAEDAEGAVKTAALNMTSWLDCIRSIFQQGSDWEVYSFVLVHLPGQLSNHPIFEDHGAIDGVNDLRKQICAMTRENSFQEPPFSSGLRKSDVANCLFQSIATLVSYHPYFRKSDEDDMVQSLRLGLSDKTAKTCIHALSIACHEIPASVSAALVPILAKMSSVITQPLVAMHILEFLACLSRLHGLYSNFREEEYRIVFGIAFRYLQYVRDKKRTAASRNNSAAETSSIPAHNDQTVTDDLPQYVYALAYHVVTFWFLALRIDDRRNQISWIANKLFKDVDGTVGDEEAVITMDFMQRVAFTDASDSVDDPKFEEKAGGPVVTKRWVIGNSIVTIKQAPKSGKAEITRRFPSGISCFHVEEQFAPVLPHQQLNELPENIIGHHAHGTSTPSHLLLQLIAPIPQINDPAFRPIPLPDEDAVKRSIRMLDLTSTVDGHKAGVIYVGDGQTDEAEILANTGGSPDYNDFLAGLGTLTTLKGATFNTQGLDRETDIDGTYTYCWRDRVTEIVFHVTTQMPTNLEHYPRSDLKKRHIGNDFVNIIFNDSGKPFDFNTFPSEFNYVYIVITPNPRPSFVASRLSADKRKEARDSDRMIDPCHMPFFTVQVMSKPGFPEISPAADPKTMSLKALPSFVRLVALNASVFSHVWANRGGEHVGSWRARLRAINQIKERHRPKDHNHNDSSSSPSTTTTTTNNNNNNPTSSPPATSSGNPSGTGNTTANNHLSGPPLQYGDSSRPASGVLPLRDSLNSLRRSSVATFFTSGGASTSAADNSHRVSLLSTTTADGEMGASQQYGTGAAADALIDSVDFSRWT